MPHANVLNDSDLVPPPIAAFFKSDRPRTIDRYIDYFGSDGTAPVAEEHAVPDAIGEELTA